MTLRSSIRCFFAGLLLLLAAGTWSVLRAEDNVAFAEAQADESQIERFTSEELHTLVAPVALYTDALLAQIIPASANPTQIVEAYRFIQSGGNPEAPPDSATWDSSVIALLHYPTVLKKMNDDLTWTEQLGIAGTYQMDELTQAIQQVRNEAMAAGNLQSNDKQVIQEVDHVIAIEPADPQVVYVPEYDPEFICERPLIDPYTWGQGYPYGIWLSNRWDWHHHHIWIGNQWSHGGWHRPSRPGYWRPPRRPIPTWYRRQGSFNRNPLGNPSRVAPRTGTSRVRPAGQARTATPAAPRTAVTPRPAVTPHPAAKTPPRYSFDREDDHNRGNQTVRESNRGQASRQSIKPAAPVQHVAPVQRPAPVQRAAPARPSFHEESRNTADRQTVQRQSSRGAASRQSSGAGGRKR